jgi:hypothetical protein
MVLADVWDGLTDLASLPTKAFALALQHAITRQVASFLGEFLAIFGLAIDCNILLILAFVLIAVIALWVINWVISLFKHHDPCDSCSIVDCNESSCCDFSEEFECDASLLE